MTPTSAEPDEQKVEELMQQADCFALSVWQNESQGCAAVKKERTALKCALRAALAHPPTSAFEIENHDLWGHHPPTSVEPVARKVFLVATGLQNNGRELYERYDDYPPPLCDAECLYAHPPTRAEFDPELMSPVETEAWNYALDMAIKIVICSDPDNYVIDLQGLKR